MSFLKRWKVPHQVGNPEVNQNFEDLERYTDGLLGEWIPLELVAALEFNAGGPIPAARFESLGTRVFFRGLLKVKAAKEVAPGATLFTLPKSMRPPKVAGMVGVTVNAHTPVYLQVETNGEVKLAIAAALAAGDQLWLDGLNYSVDK